MPDPISTLHIAFTVATDAPSGVTACILAKDAAGTVYAREVHTVPVAHQEWRALYLAFLVAVRLKPTHVGFYSDLDVVETVWQRRNGDVRVSLRPGTDKEALRLYLATLLQGLAAYWPKSSAPVWVGKAVPGNPRLKACNADGKWWMQQIDGARLAETRALAGKVAEKEVETQP